MRREKLFVGAVEEVGPALRELEHAGAEAARAAQQRAKKRGVGDDDDL